MADSKDDFNEIIIGLVSPIGCDKKHFIKQLKKEFKTKGYEVEEINLTKIIFDSKLKLPKSFEIYIKMQICSEMRTKCRGLTSAIIIEEILKIRNKKSKSKNKKKAYIVDQLKNESEYEVLTHTYGLNFTQISLFSSKHNRDDFLKSKLSSDKEDLKNLIQKTRNRKSVFSNSSSSIIKLIKDNIPFKFQKQLAKFESEIMSDCCHKLIEKDFSDPDDDYKNTGQHLSKLFHKSHYFFNLDLIESELNHEINKFAELFSGKYRECPTQDEFGMNLAFQASFRSNFPGDRHIGASIISEQGEVISVASIRAPSSTSNTKLSHRDSIIGGYNSYKKKIKKWKKVISEIQENNTTKNHFTDLDNVKKFLEDSLDFHPCTHAELAAIIDAAKLGVSLRNASLYTTTFPCHLCAKDIITAGIKRVVYLEAYPKSKSEELYPNNIDFHAEEKLGFIPFDIFFGVSPERYQYVYSLDNKDESNNKQPFPFLKYVISRYYLEKENDIIKIAKAILKKAKTKSPLLSLLQGEKLIPKKS